MQDSGTPSIPPSRFSPRRIKLVATTMFSALLLVAVLLLLFAGIPSANAQPQNDGHVIVQFDDNAHIIRPFQFTNPISGMTALTLSGLEVISVSTDFGPAICSIEGVGCPAEDCFCNADKYWGYSYWDGDTWIAYSVGAGTSVISQTDAIEGWRWGAWGDAALEPASALAALQGIEWLSARQEITTGGLGGSMGGTVEVMLAVGANDQQAAAIRRSAQSPSLADFAALHGAAYSRNSAGGAGRLAVATSATDSCLQVGAVTPAAHFSATLGAYSESMGEHAWAILGVAAIGETVPAAALASLRDAQQDDGGWEWSPGWGSDTNSTALAVQALVAHAEPVTSTAVVNALAWLASLQGEDGGFPYSAGADAESDANSTAYVIQALIAAGEEPAGSAWTQGGNTPVSFLLGLQLDDGSFEWMPDTGASALATTQAIPALLGRSFPLSMQTPDICPATFLPFIHHRADNEN